jgi:hypothetical protein
MCQPHLRNPSFAGTEHLHVLPLTVTSHALIAVEETLCSSCAPCVVTSHITPPVSSSHFLHHLLDTNFWIGNRQYYTIKAREIVEHGSRTHHVRLWPIQLGQRRRRPLSSWHRLHEPQRRDGLQLRPSSLHSGLDPYGEVRKMRQAKHGQDAALPWMHLSSLPAMLRQHAWSSLDSR